MQSDFGVNLSFSYLTNYLQCPFRLSLLIHRPEVMLFKPQFHGLFVHEWIQRYVRKHINGEEVSLKEEDVLSVIIKQDRIPTFDIHEALGEIDIRRLNSWGQQLHDFLRSYKVHTVKTEHRIEKHHRGFLFVGVLDILAYTPDGCIVIDLKHTDKVKGYDGKQVTFYSWLLDGIRVEHVFLYFLKSGGRTEAVEFELKSQEGLLRWMLHKMEQIGHIIANELWEYLPPKPFNRTCHPNRCGVYYLCPYGGLSYVHGTVDGADAPLETPLEIIITDTDADMKTNSDIGSSIIQEEHDQEQMGEL